ncbi:MAG: histidine kinase dimerization/phosphoacceptor domain -containing protein [Pseudolabrys sp.]|nr:histidine kinase dimerization/phosphoacceptor domain -containing protein [Pseudolabrys sp.]MDP2294772.1 histidine kinase dimerization/phosphoacceptor domain -containing protein [Pseudolabrys sp.]
MSFLVPSAIIPPNEAARMEAVRRYDVLDTPPDGAFDRVTALSARIFNVPIAIISIVDHDRIWFKSHHGLPVEQIDREPGLCASAILQHDPYILEDASKDVRSLTNPLVAGDFGLRFYAGVPLHTRDGYNLGTLCVIDKEVRPVSESQINDLRDLASLVMDQMELRLSARTELERASRANEQANLMAHEIEHRVANSLQFVSSILRLQGRQVPEDVASHFEMAAHRVGAVARVHRHLLDEKNAAYVSALAYITRLSEDLADILGVPVAVTGDEAQLTTKTIQSVGLLLNELVTNAAKHGAGKISVSFVATKSECKLSVCDEGKGLPPGFDFTAQKGMGMKIIDVLATQLGGGVLTASNNGRGACLVVTFPRMATRDAQ